VALAELAESLEEESELTIDGKHVRLPGSERSWG
jgi:hypothetical protein